MDSIERIAAQVALESVINMPEAFDAATIAAVIANAENNGVSDFYLDMARPLTAGDNVTYEHVSDTYTSDEF